MLICSSSHPTSLWTPLKFIFVSFWELSLISHIQYIHFRYLMAIRRRSRKSAHKTTQHPPRPLKTADLLSDDSLYYNPSLLQASQGFPVQRRLSQACHVLRGEFLPTAFKCHDRLSGKTAVRRAKRRTRNRGHSGTLRASEPGRAVKRQMPQLAPASS